jgi:hypothetical protein
VRWLEPGESGGFEGRGQGVARIRGMLTDLVLNKSSSKFEKRRITLNKDEERTDRNKNHREQDSLSVESATVQCPNLCGDVQGHARVQNTVGFELSYLLHRRGPLCSHGSRGALYLLRARA